MDLIIEITHRYIAFALSIVILALFIAAFLRRREVGVGGRGGILRPATVAGGLVVVAALLGALTVKLALNPLVIAGHLTIAMALLATLALAFSRAGGLGTSREVISTTGRTFRGARLAVILALLTVVFGALTANVPDSAAACPGFPWCSDYMIYGPPMGIHVTHRVLAFLLFGQLLGMAIATTRRKEPVVIRRAARFAFAAALTQVVIAGAMIGMQFPPVFRSLHQAFGTLVWLAVVVLAIVSSKARIGAPQEPAMRAAA